MCFARIQHVPLVVELCTRIVEARGIENQGIYRVPGNTGAVNMLQDELNKVRGGGGFNTGRASIGKWP